jgi:hypothetical protein
MHTWTTCNSAPKASQNSAAYSVTFVDSFEKSVGQRTFFGVVSTACSFQRGPGVLFVAARPPIWGAFASWAYQSGVGSRRHLPITLRQQCTRARSRRSCRALHTRMNTAMHVDFLRSRRAEDPLGLCHLIGCAVRDDNESGTLDGGFILENAVFRDADAVQRCA